jgi:hypothetical protein
MRAPLSVLLLVAAVAAAPPVVDEVLDKVCLNKSFLSLSLADLIPHLQDLAVSPLSFRYRHLWSASLASCDAVGGAQEVVPRRLFRQTLLLNAPEYLCLMLCSCLFGAAPQGANRWLFQCYLLNASICPIPSQIWASCWLRWLFRRFNRRRTHRPVSGYLDSAGAPPSLLSAVWSYKQPRLL